MHRLPLTLALLLPLTLPAQTLPAQTLIHLTTTTSTPVTFYDAATPLATLPAGAAILGIATLSAGTHTLSTGSNPLQITITPLPTTLTLTGPTTTYAGTPTTLTSAGLPLHATGTITLNSTTVPVAGAANPRLQTFGESITAAPQSYPTLLAQSLGLTLANYATPTATTCDILPTQILPNSLGPTQASTPLTTLMPGPTDTSTPIEAFTPCLQATLAWLAIPAEYKILAADPTILTTGTWTLSPEGLTLRNTSPAATARLNITSTGPPVYLWYLNSLPGTFTLTVDGTPTGTLYQTAAAPRPAYALLRLPLAAGVHTLLLTVQSGTLAFLAAAVPASPALASVHPTVLVTDLPNQNASPQPELIATYSNAIASTLSLLQSDTLDLRPVPTHPYLLGNPGEFLDNTQPSPLGHQHLADALKAIAAPLPTAPFAAFEGLPTPITLNLPTPRYLHSPIHVLWRSDLRPRHLQPLHPHRPPPGILRHHTLRPPHPLHHARHYPLHRRSHPRHRHRQHHLLRRHHHPRPTPLHQRHRHLLHRHPPPRPPHPHRRLLRRPPPTPPPPAPPLTIEVNRFSPTLIISGAPSQAKPEVGMNNSYPHGTPLTLTATIYPPDVTRPITLTDSYLAPNATTPTLNNLGPSPQSPVFPVGTHTLTATYPGDDRNLPATSPSLTLQITPIPTATTLTATPTTATPTTATLGTPITLTTTVTPSATGSITLRDATTSTITTLPLTNGTATLTTTTLTLGPHTFQASYSGDTATSPSTSQPLTVTITRIPTTLTLSPLPPPTYTGTPITLTATLSPAAATGTLIFSDTTTSLGQAPSQTAPPTLTLPGLLTGPHTLTVTYPGDDTHAPATSTPITAQVTLQPTTLTLAPPHATLPLGAPLTLTATISPATGPVTITEAATPLATATATSGTATFILTDLPGGPHTLTATYPGDATNAPATSTPITVTIAPDPTTTTLTLARLAVPSGTPAIANIRVTSPLTSTPSGTVTLRAGTLTLATGTLTNAVAGTGYATLTFPTDTLPLVPYALTATYTGSLANTPSTSAAATLTIVPIPTTVTLALTRTQLTYQTPTTLTATVTNNITPTQIPTGTLTFYANTTPLATLPVDSTATATTTFLPTLPGAYTLTAIFTPTTRFAPATTAPQLLYATLPIAVSVAPTALTIAPDASAPASVTITPLSGFTGPIALACTSPNGFITCTVDTPTPTTVAGTPIDAHLHIHVAPRLTPSTIFALPLFLPLLALRRRRRDATLLLAPILLFLSGCAEGGNFAQIPPGAYAVTITVTAGGAAVPATLAVTIPAVQ